LKLTGLINKIDERAKFIEEYQKLNGIDDSLVDSFANRINKNNIHALIQEAGELRENALNRKEQRLFNTIAEALLNVQHGVFQNYTSSADLTEKMLVNMLAKNRELNEFEWFIKVRPFLANNAELLLKELSEKGFVILNSEWGQDKGYEYYLIDERKTKPARLINIGKHMDNKIKSIIDIDKHYKVLKVKRYL